VRDVRSGGTDALEAEIRREVAAYEAEGLVIVFHSPGNVLVAPASDKSRVLSRRIASAGLGQTPETVTLPGSPERYRVVRIDLGRPGSSLELGLSFAETESTLAQFDGRVAALVLALRTKIHPVFILLGGTVLGVAIGG